MQAFPNSEAPGAVEEHNADPECKGASGQAEGDFWRGYHHSRNASDNTGRAKNDRKQGLGVAVVP